MKAAFFALVLALAASTAVQACITCTYPGTDTKVKCCNWPKNSSPVCRNGCAFKCKPNYIACGAACYRKLTYGVQTCKKGVYAYKCKPNALPCDTNCCPKGPPGSTIVCPRNKEGTPACSFTCPGGKFKCGNKCYALSGQGKGKCIKGKFVLGCQAGFSVCPGAKLCCPNGPAGSKVVCSKNPKTKVPYCDWNCGAGKFKCGGACLNAPAKPCSPWCSGNKVQCNCPKGYKRNGGWTACVKA